MQRSLSPPLSQVCYYLQIADVAAFDNGTIISFLDDSVSPRRITVDELKGKPTPQPGMYLTVYQDGYFSFSPAVAFEAGYTLIP